jgi:hypothetical protein
MLVVPSELGVGAFEGRVAEGLWFLDTVHSSASQSPTRILSALSCSAHILGRELVLV